MTDLPRENVQSFPCPPRLEAVAQRIRVGLGGAVVADTRRALRVLETHHAPTYYLPPDDVRVLLHRVARQPSPSGNLADRKSLLQPKLPNDVQKSHVDHSVAPAARRFGEGSHGSILSGNHAPKWVTSGCKSTTEAQELRMMAHLLG